MSTEPRASDLIIATFGVPEAGIYVERDGVPVRGTRPAWLDWPTVRLDEMGPPVRSRAELLRESRSTRAA